MTDNLIKKTSSQEDISYSLSYTLTIFMEKKKYVKETV